MGGRSVPELVAEPGFLSTLLLTTPPETAASFLQESLLQSEEKMEASPEFLGELLQRTPPRTAARFLANMQQLQTLADAGSTLPEATVPAAGGDDEGGDPGGAFLTSFNRVAGREHPMPPDPEEAPDQVVAKRPRARYTGKDAFESLGAEAKAWRLLRLPEEERGSLYERVPEDELEVVEDALHRLQEERSPSPAAKGGVSKLKRKGLARIQALKEHDEANQQAKLDPKPNLNPNPKRKATKQAKLERLAAAKARNVDPRFAIARTPSDFAVVSPKVEREQAEAELAALRAKAEADADAAAAEKRRADQARYEACLALCVNATLALLITALLAGRARAACAKGCRGGHSPRGS